MTVAAIDRLVHHATIIEIQAESFRKKQAMARNHVIDTPNRKKDGITNSLQQKTVPPTSNLERPFSERSFASTPLRGQLEETSDEADF